VETRIISKRYLPFGVATWPHLENEPVEIDLGLCLGGDGPQRFGRRQTFHLAEA
jgi:hypothetical protein